MTATATFQTGAARIAKGGYEVKVNGETVLLTEWHALALARHRNLRREGLPAVVLYTSPTGETCQEEGLPLRRPARPRLAG